METADFGRGQGSARTGDKTLAAVIHDYGGPERTTTEEVAVPALGRWMSWCASLLVRQTTLIASSFRGSTKRPCIFLSSSVAMPSGW